MADRPHAAKRRLLVLLPLLLLLAPPLVAQENDECLACHSDPDLTGQRSGVEISVHVSPEAYEGSVHGGMDCVTCHVDLEGTELPHAEDVAPVQCANCHDEEASVLAGSVHGAAGIDCADCHGNHAIARPSATVIDCGKCHASAARDHRRSLHGRAAARGDALAPGCATCHGSHDVRAHDDPASPIAVMNIPALCGRCHKEGAPVAETRQIPEDHILANYSMSIHGEGLFRQGLTVTAVCTSCHTAHRILPHTDPDSSIHHDNVARTCAHCHGQIERVHRAVIQGRLWKEEPQKIPACVDCHSPHKIRRVFYPAGLANQDCLRCHSDPALQVHRDNGPVSGFVDADAYATSKHAGIACAQCHTDVDPSRERPCEPARGPVDCGVCHADRVAEYQTSIHGTLRAEGDPDAPTCLDCHDKHATAGKATPTSPTYPRNVPLLCARCHRQGEKAAVRIETDIDDIYQSYLDSIHGKGLVESGLVVTATCADCHSAHGELPPEDPRSTVNHANVAATCGKCHHGIEETFETSVHWPGNTKTDRKLPTCEDCHSSHNIARTGGADFRLHMMDQCGHCHETEAETFFDTFHGKVSRLGSAGAAKCFDCHGTHNILPPTSPESTLGRDHVVQTCGKCHEAAHVKFAGYLTHATHHDPRKYPWLFWSFWGMTALLVGTLTFSLAHTGAWLIRLWLTREEWRATKRLARANSAKLYRRFDRLQRTMHLIMLLSFFTLALTGMTLKFSYMGWAQTLSWLLGGFDTMSILHRIGAVTLFTIFGVHLWDVRRRKKRSGRTWRQVITGPDSILFHWRDLLQFLQSIRWFFGLGERPKYGRYSYWEKFDYFAVFWGVLVIGSTGLLLWFPEVFTHLLPGWSVNVATIIHSDEALLAVAFIFTIHFFNTHFRPDKFPMDPVIFTGRVTLDELKHDKPAEYEEAMARGDLESRLVDPFPQPVVHALKVFGFIALGVGLLLIGLIVYAMLFGYR